MKTIHIGGLTADLFLPQERPIESASYILDAFRQDFTKFPDLTDRKSALIFLSGMDWNRDLSPWPAPPLYPKEEPFSGGAGLFLKDLLNRIIPTIEKAMPTAPKARQLAGVSLAGLFAVFAACRTDAFTRIASISGSLWYDGLSDFLAAHSPSPLLSHAYFSLGSKEKNVRNARMRTVETSTIAIAASWKSKGIHTYFERNPGNHFADGPERIVKALRWLEIGKP